MLTALAAVAFWAVALAMATSYVTLERDRPAYQPMQLPVDAIVVLTGAAHCLAIRAGLDRLVNRPFGVQVAVTALLVLTCALPFENVMRGVVGLVFHGDIRHDLLPFTRRVLIQGSMFWSAPFGVWAVGNLALLHDREARRRERRLAALQIQAHEAQVRALRYQVNPHFLFNTLNAIASLILDRRNDAAEAMVLRLSDFFRTSLAQDPLRDTTLAEEIAVQRLYLDIERARFTDRLEVEIDLPRNLQPALTPSLILQPIVENALKHGLRDAGEAMTLRLTARADADRLTIEVQDNGRGQAAAIAPGAGVGLRNVEARLAARFPGQSHLEAGAVPGGYRVRLTFPLEFA